MNKQPKPKKRQLYSDGENITKKNDNAVKKLGGQFSFEVKKPKDEIEYYV